MKACALLILFVVLALYLSAQHTLYNKGALLHTTKDALLHVEGEIENSDTSVIENDGVIELTGDFTNASTAKYKNGSDNSSTERVCKFIGSGTQVIKGDLSDSSNRYIYNLIIDKSVSASVVQMQTAIYIKGSLVFGSITTGADTYTPTGASTTTNNSGKGIVKTFDDSNTDYELFVTNSSANAVKGYASLSINGNPADGFIQNRGVQGIGVGGFSRNVSATGTAYVFPVGTSANGYNAASLTFTSLGANPDKITTMFIDAAGGVGSLANYCYGCDSTGHDSTGFNYRFSSNSCNNNNPSWVVFDALADDHGYWSYTGNSSDQYFIETFPNSFSGLQGSENDTWRMIKKTGSISAVPSGDWTEQISSALSDISDLLTYTKNTGCYTGNGVPGGTYTGFSHFQMARAKSNTPLPVELIYLTALPVENKFIQLTWATALEINNRGFEVLRSVNGNNFEQIGWADANGTGNSTVESGYSFDDVTALPEIVYYYKLNQLDFDGASKETYLVDAQLSADGSLKVSDCFPNPSVSLSHFAVQSSSDIKLFFELYDFTGRLIQKEEISASKGNSQFEINTGALQQGTYKALIKSDNQVFTRTLHIIQ